MDEKVTNLTQFREDRKVESGFLNILDEEMKKEGAVQPIPKSLFERIARLQQMAEAQPATAPDTREELLEG
ncbi:hypothetical protein [Sansalvadorimonas verongulae]|uniref:hypothetical protein n=1 Tax=Sansalvadorimonas verongulae TaxID=2172824 RepID=UPI0012BBEBE8|nr:hypothetical protein [Sansalvadorimonas verongulae]MTI12784.1 hypothetical protein [Sansalvadorimonas verongulae]